MAKNFKLFMYPLCMMMAVYCYSVVELADTSKTETAGDKNTSAEVDGVSEGTSKDIPADSTNVSLDNGNAQLEVSISKTIPNHFPSIEGIIVPEKALVSTYKTRYTNKQAIEYLSAVMKRSVPYRAFILSEIERLDAPEFLLYLPVIESGFSATAVSRSGATGIWQFMKNSIGGYNIRINEWMDERRDPWITSTAAIRKLNDNFKELKDWNLALAAYNCGLGATKIAMKKGGSNDYWYLAEKGFFKAETVHYVPKFWAIAEILSKSTEYGIDWGEAETIDTYTTLPVKRPIDVALLAKEAGIDSSTLTKANPALFYNITPPEVTYGLRIPKTHEQKINEILSDSKRMLIEFYMYKIKSGDTLYALALHYGISTEMILQYNPQVKPNSLQIGKSIVIPALKEVRAYQGKKDPDTLDFSGSYLVKKGDSLWSIALAYNIQVETLAEKNNISVSSVLSLGKVLRVPIL